MVPKKVLGDWLKMFKMILKAMITRFQYHFGLFSISCGIIDPDRKKKRLGDEKN
jgi:hypothetical protein